MRTAGLRRQLPCSLRRWAAGPARPQAPASSPCSAGTVGDLYFPASLTARNPASELDAMERGRLARELGLLGEKSLRCPAPRAGRTAYRVLWLPSCNPSIAVRMEVSGSSATLHGARLSSLIFGEQKRIEGTVQQLRTDLPLAEAKPLLDSFRNGGFWSEPTMEPGEAVLLDGEIFVIERADEGRYRVLKRNHRRNPSLRAAIESLIRAAGFDPSVKGC